MNKALTALLKRQVQIEEHQGFLVVREDLTPGGSKMRFLPYVVDPKAPELVFGGPFCGGAPLTLSEIGKRTGQKVTLFYAKRAKLHPRQEKARANGAKLMFVEPGYMNVVQKRARDYAAKRGAMFLNLGFDEPRAEEPFVAFMEKVRKGLKKAPRTIWCATGSGMLARCLGKAFPDSQVVGVAVGLASRHDKQEFPSNVRLEECGYAFAQTCKIDAPFTSCPNYDRKAWEVMLEKGKKGDMLWNVL
jgi:hypothetical protein